MSERLTTEFEQSAYSQVVLARELFDRDEIEGQARELLLGHNFNKYPPLANEANDNAVTALFEELTAAGDLSVLRFEGDQHMVHRDTLVRILNGYSESAPQWESRRRFAEICEELQVHKYFREIKEGLLPADSLFVVISDFPDDAANLSEAHDSGYRAGNKKGMIRSYHFEQATDGQWVRVLEQLSRSNSTDGSTREWFNNNANAVPLHATGALHETMVISRQRLPDGVITLVEELDGPGRRYGETCTAAALYSRPNYDSVRRVSKERRHNLERFTEELARLEQHLLSLLQAGQISYPEKLRRYYDKQDEIVDRIAIMDSKYARDARGEAAVVFYEQAGMALLAGDKEKFNMNLHTAHRVKDPFAGSACGGRGRETRNDGPQNPEEQGDSLFDKSKEDKKHWKWKDGICRVPSCGKKTKVGPCNVCEKCQKRFDKGEDPTKDSLRSEPAKAKKFGWQLFKAAQI